EEKPVGCSERLQAGRSRPKAIARSAIGRVKTESVRSKSLDQKLITYFRLGSKIALSPSPTKLSAKIVSDKIRHGQSSQSGWLTMSSRAKLIIEPQLG